MEIQTILRIIGILIAVGFYFWLGYQIGKNKGRIEGIEIAQKTITEKMKKINIIEEEKETLPISDEDLPGYSEWAKK